MKIQSLKVRKILFLISFLFVPLITFAQLPPQNPQISTPEDFKGFVNLLLGMIGLGIPVLIGIAFVAFIIGMSKFVLNADSEEGRKEGKRMMVWGSITLFIMISVWGIIRIVLGGFGYELIFPQLRTS